MRAATVRGGREGTATETSGGAIPNPVIAPRLLASGGEAEPAAAGPGRQPSMCPRQSAHEQGEAATSRSWNGSPGRRRSSDRFLVAPARRATGLMSGEWVGASSANRGPQGSGRHRSAYIDSVGPLAG